MGTEDANFSILETMVAEILARRTAGTPAGLTVQELMQQAAFDIGHTVPMDNGHRHYIGDFPQLSAPSTWDPNTGAPYPRIGGPAAPFYFQPVPDVSPAVFPQIVIEENITLPDEIKKILAGDMENVDRKKLLRLLTMKNQLDAAVKKVREHLKNPEK